MKKWGIKTKRDWIIAFIFATLLVYAATGLFTQRLDRMLMYVTDPRLSDLNQPSSYGNVALTALIMGAAAGIVLHIKKRPVKMTILSVLAGCVIAAVSIGAYFFHCSLLVHVPQEETPGNIWVSRGWDNESASFCENYDPSDEELVEFVRLCTSLEELPREEQRQADLAYEENRSEDGSEEIRIWISYPEKYLHSYSLLLVIENGQVFSRRDGGADRTFFADNGVVEAAENMIR